jgi:methylamine dehydrogenase accessory protein MauD
MPVALLIARFLVALAFAIAGVAKLLDLAGSRRALEEFGLPRRMALPLGTLLPIAEIAVAAALIPAASAKWGAIAAVSLLFVLTAGIAGTLISGRRPDCHCFGQLYSAPIGWGTLLRNGTLMALAVFVAWGGEPAASISVIAWSEALIGDAPWTSAALAIVLALLCIETWLLVEMIRQHGRILLRLDTVERRLGIPESAAAAAPDSPGLPVGHPAPGFTLPGLFGEALTLDALRARGKPVLLMFTDPTCGPCEALVPDLARWQKEYESTATIAIISRGKVEENRAKLGTRGLNLVLLQKDREVSLSYGVAGTPSAVLLRADGTIASPLAQGAEQIRALVAPLSVPAPSPAGNGAVPAPATKLGEPVPPMQFPDLAGKTVALAGSGGRETLLLFWDPGCGFCQQMIADVKALEARLKDNGPRLVLVSTGTVEVNRASGFRSPVLLDQSFAAGRALGVMGTPSAVLVDREGKVASGVAVGAPAVLDLAASHTLSGGDKPAAPRMRQRRSSDARV